LAVAAHYLDPKVMDAIDKAFKQNNIHYFRAKDVPSLKNLTDNYYLSLVEQEISATCGLFCRSDSSTWSDYIVDWVRETGRASPTIVSIGQLLQANNLTFATWNREHDEEKLKQYKRQDGWWKN